MAMRRFAPAAAFAFCASVTMRLAAGFGYLSFPPASYRDLKHSQIYSADFNTSIHPMLFGLRQRDSREKRRPDARAALFVNQLVFSDYLSLRELADTVLPGCGNSMVGIDVEPVNVYNARHLLWRNEDEKVGFYPRTSGPCETWLDNERVHFHGNCVRAYSTYPAKIPIDFSRCRRGQVCELRFYWIAVATTPLKLMKHCVRVVNSPYLPAAKENTNPYQKLTQAINDTSFSVDLTITLERVWLEGDEGSGYSSPSNPGPTILILA